MRETPTWFKNMKTFAENDSRISFWRKCGPYLIIHEQVGNPPHGPPGYTLMRSAYSPEGLYLGSTKTAHLLWKKYGITRFFGNDKIAFVGQSDRHVWHGWSHRAIGKFKKGEWKRKNRLPHEGRGYRIVDPRKVAFAFAAEVS